jgi:hypothetical protein
MIRRRFPSRRMTARRYVALGAASLLFLALAGPSARGQTGSAAPDPVAELIRKADAKEPENGFCATVADWPPGSGQSYLHFLEIARVGFAKINTFKDGADCQFDRVTAVYQGNSGKCVRYIWWACARGSTCGYGEDTDCKQADGQWVRQR